MGHGHTGFDIGIAKKLIGKESAASLISTRLLKPRDTAASMTRELHVPPLFKRYLDGGRAMGAAVGLSTHSSVLIDPADGRYTAPLRPGAPG
jgi:hypothetical protein